MRETKQVILKMPNTNTMKRQTSYYIYTCKKSSLKEFMGEVYDKD